MAKDDQGKLVAIISYLTIIGWVIAIVLNSQNKTAIGSFHIRQTLLLFLIAFALFFIPIIGWIANLGTFVLWIIGLIGAVQGQQKEVPLVGKYAQEWFKSL